MPIFLGPPVRDTGGPANTGGGATGVGGIRPENITTYPPASLKLNTTYLTAPRAALELMAVNDSIWVLESPIVMVAGESKTFTITYEDAAAVSSPSALAYKDGTDVTSTLFPAGSITASGVTVTLKPLTGLIGGDVYVINVTATVDGSTVIKKIKIIAADPKDE